MIAFASRFSYKAPFLFPKRFARKSCRVAKGKRDHQEPRVADECFEGVALGVSLQRGFDGFDVMRQQDQSRFLKPSEGVRVLVVSGFFRHFGQLESPDVIFFAELDGDGIEDLVQFRLQVVIDRLVPFFVHEPSEIGPIIPDELLLHGTGTKFFSGR